VRVVGSYEGDEKGGARLTGQREVASGGGQLEIGYNRHGYETMWMVYGGLCPHLEPDNPRANWEIRDLFIDGQITCSDTGGVELELGEGTMEELGGAVAIRATLGVLAHGFMDGRKIKTAQRKRYREPTLPWFKFRGCIVKIEPKTFLTAKWNKIAIPQVISQTASFNRHERHIPVCPMTRTPPSEPVRRPRRTYHHSLGTRFFQCAK